MSDKVIPGKYIPFKYESLFFIYDSLYKLTVKMVSDQRIEGIIYHVLKGQIEYDFELGRLEETFEKMDVPVFRLETDYNYQDVEQLRIRLEAFSEVLQQKKYGKEALAI